ncbi:hypothetical protein TSAR_007817 [Trichomalopsis sarcophagae]|uniref:Uncharacterized protein n=1 Tax=Trichomalopsis sarcophagae TaxID=543379 RepID=A0A232FIU9_9HYME|nr:hypothetical protein TSAR_007817 [Trichomalopsis sarcophagae]
MSSTPDFWLATTIFPDTRQIQPQRASLIYTFDTIAPILTIRISCVFVAPKFLNSLIVRKIYPS